MGVWGIRPGEQASSCWSPPSQSTEVRRGGSGVDTLLASRRPHSMSRGHEVGPCALTRRAAALPTSLRPDGLVPALRVPTCCCSSRTQSTAPPPPGQTGGCVCTRRGCAEPRSPKFSVCEGGHPSVRPVMGSGQEAHQHSSGGTCTSQPRRHPTGDGPFRRERSRHRQLHVRVTHEPRRPRGASVRGPRAHGTAPGHNGRHAHSAPSCRKLPEHASELASVFPGTLSP